MRKKQEAIWDYCRFPCIGDWLRLKKLLNTHIQAKSINQNGLPGVNKKNNEGATKSKQKYDFAPNLPL